MSTPKINPRAKAAAVSFDNLDVSIQRDLRATTRPSIGTAPGQAMQNAALRSELEQWKGATPVRHLDPTSVIESKWANRLEDSFSNDEFRQLKEEILSSGGNVQPIKVRPAPGKPGIFEIVYGHRRHRACLELGLPVLAMIVEMVDEQMFIDMERENRSRADLCPLEQGLMYLKALEENLFPSQSRLADKTGAHRGNVGLALKLARLPKAVVSAFPSKHDLQYRWASDLAQAVESRFDQVVALAEKIASEVPRPSSKEVFERLTRDPGHADESAASFAVSLEGDNGQKAKIVVSPGSMTMTVSLKQVDARRAAELELIIQKFLR